MFRTLLIAAGLAGTLLGTGARASDGNDRPDGYAMPQQAILLQGADADRYLDFHGAPRGSGVQVEQSGFGHAAGAHQTGSANDLLIRQEGRGHTGTVRQIGHGNRYGLVQLGQNTSAHGVQIGTGQSAVVIMRGWGW